MTLDTETKKNVNSWLNGDFDPATKEEIQKLEKDDPTELTNAFYTRLDFGTGGLRGLMGIGTNRMNIYTVRGATQGLANYINKHTAKGNSPSVLIGYDSRQHSKEFAEEAAKVLAVNGINAFIYSDIRPVPMVSFGCRYKKCQAAIMITASHNPPRYNGYKVYWADGGQVLPPHDKGIIEEVNKVQDPSKVKTSKIDDPHIHWIQEEIDEAYLKQIEPLQHTPEINQDSADRLKIIYTPLHGTGITMVPKALAMWNFLNLYFVESQKKPDGRFPTVSSPNPEEPSAMKLGIERLLELNGDILIATDPDADRMGVAVNHQGKVTLLNGNEISCICLEHILSSMQTKGKIPPHPAVIKTIVTTDLFKAIAEHYHVDCYEVLTGFKYIGELMTQWEKKKDSPHFIFGGEESYGYLLSTYARDKDAVISSLVIAEAALQAKLQSKTLLDTLNGIYQKYGVYRERLTTVKFPETKEGREKMDKALDQLRRNPPNKILGTDVIIIEDYQISLRTFIDSGKTEKINLPKSDVLLYRLEDGTKIIVRPSGTEPKIKLYCGTKSKKNSPIDLGIEHCDTLAKEYLKTIEMLLKF